MQREWEDVSFSPRPMLGLCFTEAELAMARRSKMPRDTVLTPDEARAAEPLLQGNTAAALPAVDGRLSRPLRGKPSSPGTCQSLPGVVRRVNLSVNICKENCFGKCHGPYFLPSSSSS